MPGHKPQPALRLKQASVQLGSDPSPDLITFTSNSSPSWLAEHHRRVLVEKAHPLSTVIRNHDQSWAGSIDVWPMSMARGNTRYR